MQQPLKRNRIQSLPYKGSSKLSKYKIIMNDLNIDCGYPQQIITHYKPNEEQHNFIQGNKQNLKNFFKDRLPQNSVSKKLYKQNKVQFDSLRMFQIKTQQLQLKSQTKMVLNDSFLDKNRTMTNYSNKRMQKVQEIFLLNDKTLEFKNKFQPFNHVNRLRSYNKDNHRRQTHSFMQKRCNLLKKQAYQKVFGLNQSLVSKTVPVSPNNKQDGDNYSIRKNKNLKQKMKNKTFYGKVPKEKEENLCTLLKKMDDFKNKFKTVKLDYKQVQGTSMQLNKSQQSQTKENTQKIIQKHPSSSEKKKLLNLVQNITNLYRQEAVSQNNPKLTCIQDLQKANPKFYHDLSQHKKNRMDKRLFQLYKYSVPELDDMIQSKFKGQSVGISNWEFFLNGNKGKVVKQDDDGFSVSDNNDEEDFNNINLKPRKRLTIHEKFRNLGIHLIKAHLLSKFYQVKPANFYPAFWQVRQPFQMQGSYAFFKAIKLNDLQCVKSFININMDYLYELDMNCKTPLIYACYHNQQQIVAYFLELGCNVDKLCGKRKTALFYALQNKNLQITQMLLQYGASPWSIQNNPYSKLIRQMRNYSMQILFSNAKKIYLATRLYVGSQKRQQFWHLNKKRIVYSQKIHL